MEDNSNQDVQIVGGKMPNEKKPVNIVSKTPRLDPAQTKIVSKHTQPEE